MSERYEQLFEGKSTESADKILSLCGFEGKEEYFEHESEIVRECFCYLESGKSDAQCAYLLRSSQQKAELSVNQGNLTAPELHQLVGRTLSEDEVSQILALVELEPKEEYTFTEADSFLESHHLIESESDNPSTASNSTASDSISLLELKQLASLKLSISQLLQILPLCGLKEQDFYTQKQAEIFVSCCDLLEMGKSKAEIAQHFGVAHHAGDNYIKQVFDSIAHLSELQQQKILEIIANKVVNQRTQVEKTFDHLTYTGLTQAFGSGELQTLIDRKIEQNLGNEISLQALVETWTEQQSVLLPPESNNILPSS